MMADPPDAAVPVPTEIASEYDISQIPVTESATGTQTDDQGNTVVCDNETLKEARYRGKWRLGRNVHCHADAPDTDPEPDTKPDTHAYVPKEQRKPYFQRD